MRKISITGIIFFILLSCDPARVYEKNITIPEGLWNRYHTVIFEIEMDDTITPHNIYINIRNGSYYPYCNLFIFITVTAPDGKHMKDTVEIKLADDSGKWYGKGLGDIWDLQRMYKQNIRFPVEGIYTFEYQQAMRNENLPYILDVGLRIEKAK